jgi:glycosyltransferase involved in cell wall biosynthesis
MNVLLLTPELPPDDRAKVPHHILQEIRLLSLLPVKLHVLTGVQTSIRVPAVSFHVMPQTGRAPLETARSFWFGLRHGLGIHNYAASKKNRFAFEAILNNRIDVVHSHWAYPEGTGAAWAAHAAGIPCIMTLRGVEINVDRNSNYGYRLNRSYESVLRHSLQLASRITVASSESMRSVESLIGASGKTLLIPNGIDLERFRSSDSKAAIAASSPERSVPFRILTLGNLVRNKRFDVVISAISLLRTRGRDVRCIVAGEGPMRAALEHQIHTQSLQGVVTLEGSVHFDEVPSYFAGCDAFAFASAAEGFGNVLAEAMAMSRPVVSTPVGVARDVIRDGVNGFIVPPGDARAMAERLEHLMDHPECARAMGERARGTVVEQLTIQRRVESFYELYQQCLSMSGREELSI